MVNKVEEFIKMANVLKPKYIEFFKDVHGWKTKKTDYWFTITMERVRCQDCSLEYLDRFSIRFDSEQEMKDAHDKISKKFLIINFEAFEEAPHYCDYEQEV